MAVRRGKTIKVLDKGFVKLVDYMGSDQRIVQAARVSYSGKGTKTFREDAALIDYLWRNGHTSPFEMNELVFHMKMPIFVARQLIRHRTASVNEISGRYSVLKDEFFVPEPSRLRKQSTDNKQGSSDEVIDHARSITKHMAHGQALAYHDYETYLETDMAKELARINLPLSTYTEWIWKIDLNNFFKTIALRADGHAQEEIRVYADAMLQMAEELFPAAVASFKEHTLYGVRLSKTEVDLVRNLITELGSDALEDVLLTIPVKRQAEFLKKLGIN